VQASVRSTAIPSAPGSGPRHPRPKILIALVAGFILLAVSAVPVFNWLSPESSPLARGASYAASHRCLENDCATELSGEITCRELPNGTSCQDVEIYWRVAALKLQYRERLENASNNWLLNAEGLARERNCFRCHGELGQGGFDNVGALKGYIPGYFGKDFRALTEDGNKDVVEEWIKTGMSQSLIQHPLTGALAEYFINQQAVAMPIFSSLPDDEVSLLADYLLVLNALGPLGKESIACYVFLTAQRELPPSKGRSLNIERCARSS
jgi:cytochrome c553